jgi:hypothetical protein
LGFTDKATVEEMFMSESESSSNKGLDFSSVAAAGATYQIKLFEIAQANMQLAFEYAQALTAVRSSGEFVSVTSEYAKKRMDMFNKHTKELAEFLPSQLRGETKPE